jgi:hypothetical protein
MLEDDFAETGCARGAGLWLSQVAEEKRRISAAAAEARARRMGGSSTVPAASAGPSTLQEHAADNHR